MINGFNTNRGIKGKKLYYGVFALLIIFLILIFFILDHQSVWQYNNDITPSKSITDKVVFSSGLGRKQIEQVKVNYDFLSDNSIKKYVSISHPFNNLLYEPSDLLLIKKSKFLLPTKNDIQLRKEALESLNSLANDFFIEFKTPFIIFSAYRSYSYQKGIKDGGCSDSLCAKAGYSEHQTGLAIDVFDASTEKEFISNEKYKKYFEWMKENAYKYGFHNSYQNGIDIDGYDVEPWHWRYVGKDLAKELFEEKITFTQYYK